MNRHLDPIGISATGNIVPDTGHPNSETARRSKADSRLIHQKGFDNTADHLLESLKALTWRVIRDRGKDIITVTEDRIVQAMGLAWERAELLIEPVSAVALAVALSDDFRGLQGMRRVGIILSGGNVNLDRLPWRVHDSPRPTTMTGGLDDLQCTALLPGTTQGR